MNQTSIERLLEEFDLKFSHSTYIPDGYGGAECNCNNMKDWLRSALSQARQEGREEAVEYINHNLMWGRDSKGNLVMDSKHVTEVLQDALTTEGK